MAGEPHDDAAFANSVTYTVKVTMTVRGGVRRDTADRRARRVAERVADAAARAKDVVEATAVAGPSRDGEILWPNRVHFPAANTGRDALGEVGKLDRYLDPDHELALRSLSAARRRQQAHREADRRRRAAVGCRNTLSGVWDEPRCRCVYCEPDDHYVARQLFANTDPTACGPPPCVCGQPTPAGARCLRHRDVQIVALDGDPEALHAFANTHLQEPNR